MKIFIKTFFLFALLAPMSQLFAANIIIEKVLPAGNDIKVGDEVLLNLSLLSEGVEHNAIEGVLKIPPIFTIDKVVTGNSFVTVWLDDPANFNDDTINFSGITPAGYNREAGLIFSIVLKATAPGKGGVALTEMEAYVNDGLGTRVSLDNKQLPLTIRELKDGELPYLILVKDETPPEDFKIELLKNTELFGGKYALIWNTRDQGSGIAGYDVYEGNRVFKQVTSPYLLENQRLNGKIKVVAYDHEGNTRDTEIIPPGRVCIGVDCFSYAKLVVILALVFVTLVLIWRKSKK